MLTAMATPFDENGNVDTDGARRLAAHLLEHGSHGLVVAATSGELPTLTDEEEVLLLRAVREEVGEDVLLVCGAGTNDTRHSCELTKMVADAGADASLVVAPYYNKPNRAGLRAHFEAVAAAVPELPLIMYNIPSRVVINMPPDLLAELATVYEGLSVTTNPIPIKAALEMLGLAPGRMRLPLVPVDAEQRATVRAALEGIGLPVAS